MSDVPHKKIHPDKNPKQKRCENRRPQTKADLENQFPMQSSQKTRSKLPNGDQSYVPRQSPSDPQEKLKQAPNNSRFQTIIRNIGKSENVKKRERAAPKQTKFTPPRANLRFQLTNKHHTVDPQQIWQLAWGCEALGRFSF